MRRSYPLEKSVRRVISNFKPGAEPIEVLVAKEEEHIADWFRKNLPKCSRDPKSNQKVVGFDVEWRPSFYKGLQNKISLVQFATPTSALLIQMKFVHRPPPALVEIVSSKDIMKVGVGILADLQRLEQDFGVPFNNFHDIGSAARRIDSQQSPCPPDSSSSFGLAALVERFLGIKMMKPKKVQMSNWEKRALSEAQITYAAYDAIMGREVFDYLQELGAFERESVLSTTDLLFSEAMNTSSAETGGATRSTFRRIHVWASESDALIEEIGSNIQREDEKWLQDLENGRKTTVTNNIITTVDTVTGTGTTSTAAAVGGDDGGSSSPQKGGAESLFLSTSNSNNAAAVVLLDDDPSLAAVLIAASGNSNSKDSIVSAIPDMIDIEDIDAVVAAEAGVQIQISSPVADNVEAAVAAASGEVSSSNVWRSALCVYLSRLSWSPYLHARRQQQPPQQHKQLQDQLLDRRGHKNGGASAKNKQQQKKIVTIDVVVSGVVVGSFEDSCETVAREQACKLVLTELVRGVQPLVPRSHLLPAFAGRAPLPELYVEYLEAKRKKSQNQGVQQISDTPGEASSQSDSRISAASLLTLLEPAPPAQTRTTAAAAAATKKKIAAGEMEEGGGRGATGVKTTVTNLLVAPPRPLPSSPSSLQQPLLSLKKSSAAASASATAAASVAVAVAAAESSLLAAIAIATATTAPAIADSCNGSKKKATEKKSEKKSEKKTEKKSESSSKSSAAVKTVAAIKGGGSGGSTSTGSSTGRGAVKGAGMSTTTSSASAPVSSVVGIESLTLDPPLTGATVRGSKVRVNVMS